jgi:hypothetical protein
MMMGRESRERPTPGKAIDDEDPEQSPMDGLAMPTGPAQPYDVDRLEEDRAKSIGPKPGSGKS